MWADLVTAYASHTGCHVLDIVNSGGAARGPGDAAAAERVIGAEIFTNDRIKRSLPEQGRTAVVDALIAKGAERGGAARAAGWSSSAAHRRCVFFPRGAGKADWLDKGRGVCLVFPRRLQDLADVLYDQVRPLAAGARERGGRIPRRRPD